MPFLKTSVLLLGCNCLESKGEKRKGENGESKNLDEIVMLKKHLKQKYSNYTDQEIDEIIQKFIQEYLTNLKETTDESNSQE